MKLHQIQLYNFGSYEGDNVFDFSASDDNKRIIIIGGKNGAGKTTLFTAIQTGLYGHYAFGYKSAGKQYFTEIGKLINEQASMDEQNKSFVRIRFSHTQSTDCFDYDIVRTWYWDGDIITETLTVFRDGIMLENDEIDNFQNFLIHLIPPDLLKLYFFDGEKIADYFLSEQRINIREALMTLSGNDTFDILHRNVTRVLNQNRQENNLVADNYLRTKHELDSLSASLSEARLRLAETEENDLMLHEEYERYTDQYTKRGGLSLSEWKQLQADLKDEEKKREHINFRRKELATDILPFLIIKDLVNEIPEQIKSEEEFFSYMVLQEKFRDGNMRDLLNRSLKNIGIQEEEKQFYVYRELLDSITEEKWQKFKPILQLSDDEKLETLSVIKRMNDTDLNQFDKFQNELNESIKRSSTIRNRLTHSNAENIETFLETTKSYESQILASGVEVDRVRASVEELAGMVEEKTKQSSAARKQYEAELKKQSVSNISGRVLFLLEDLQREVYHNLIREVQYDLQTKWGELIQKENFFDNVYIDEDFNVRVIRKQAVNVKDLKQMVKKRSIQFVKDKIGIMAYHELTLGLEYSKAELLASLEDIKTDTITLPLEFDKNTMSSGEKQMFVMALYWALMQQSDNDLPFIIDTPFARIDEQHRANITEHFFMDLNGQLMVLSTNEEIADAHISAMESQIARVFTLEYDDDEKRTYIHADEYFEV